MSSQVVIYFLAQFTNVVSINTFIVFVRLYWFEKRFQHVVKEAMTWRRTRSRSRTNTHGLEELGEEREKRGVDGRDIVVLESSGRPIGRGSDIQLDGQGKSDPESSSNSSDGRKGHTPSERNSTQELQPALFTRNITFADDVASPGARSTGDRIPQQLTPEQNIAFLERQRNPTDNEILRIPGPRESDRGQDPEALRNEIESPLSPEVEGQDRHITFPHVASTRIRSNTQGLSFPRTGTGRSQGASSALDRAPSAYLLRRSSGTFSGMQRASTGQTTVPPYLSWQPTIGRNSAFVDLTEEQREELGGIEYRSLKLLAIILVCKSDDPKDFLMHGNELRQNQRISSDGT